MSQDPADTQHAVITDEMVAEAQAMVGVWMRRDVHWQANAAATSDRNCEFSTVGSKYAVTLQSKPPPLRAPNRA